MKISIRGCSGSGKSTLAQQLEVELALPWIELDGLMHQPEWQPLEKSLFQEQVLALLDQSESRAGGWIVDGNYESNLAGAVTQRADIVIWFNLPRDVVMRRIIKRSLLRVLTRKVLWNGNRESLWSLLRWNPELSVIRWAWTRHQGYAKKLMQQAQSAPSKQTWLEIKDDKDLHLAQEFLRTQLSN